MGTNSEELKKQMAEEQIARRKLTQQREALSILDDVKTFNKAEDLTLRGDGVFMSGRGHGNVVSSFDVLKKYHLLATTVERAYMLLHNSIGE